MTFVVKKSGGGSMMKSDPVSKTDDDTDEN